MNTDRFLKQFTGNRSAQFDYLLEENDRLKGSLSPDMVKQRLQNFQNKQTFGNSVRFEGTNSFGLTVESKN